MVGLATAMAAARSAAAWVANTMAGALAFGCVNHSVLAGPDHVSHVAEQWRPVFATTAALLAALEGVAAVLAMRIAWRIARANYAGVVTSFVRS